MAEPLSNAEVMAIHSLPFVRSCLLEYAERPVDETADAVVRAIATQIDALTGSREALMDAARYRWLRQRHWDDSNMCVVVDPKVALRLGSYCPSGNLLDDRIDSALKGEQPS